MSEKLVLIDGHSILNRAFYGVPDLTNSEGMHTNAVYGFLNILFKILEEENPAYLAVAFDVKQPTFRHKMYEAYKGTRKPMPEELRQQVPVVQDVLRAMNIPVIMQAGYEADDILGTLAVRAQKEGKDVSLVSGDRDLLQLASEHILIRIPKTKRGGTEIENYHTQEVIDKMGITPAQVTDMKGLMGDSADNIPGVPGIGEKTAAKILSSFATLEDAYEHIDEVEPKRIRELLRANEEIARLSKTLATIKTDCETDFSFEEAKYENLFTKEAFAWIKKLELKSLEKKFDAAVKKDVTAPKTEYLVFDSKKEAEQLIKDIHKSGCRAVSIAFLADAWENGGVEKKKTKKKNGGQLNLFFDEQDRMVSFKEESEEAEYPFYGMSVAYIGKEEVTACMFVSERYSAQYLIETARKIQEQTDKIIVLDWKNMLHITTPVEQLSEKKQPPCQQLFSDDTYEQTQQLFGKITDVAIGAYLLNPLKGSYRVDDIARDYTGLTAASYEELFEKQKLSSLCQGEEFERFLSNPKEKHPLGEKLITYLGNLSYTALLSEREITKQLEEMQMNRIFTEIEIPTAYYLYQMERTGVHADRGELEAISKLLEGREKALEQEIYALAGEEFNINSPKQLGTILFEKMKLPFGKKTKTGYSTSAEVLEKLRKEDPIVGRILDYRQISKLKSTYADGLPVFIEEDGRIHGKFNQMITATGRISSTDPNLQNIPIRMELGREIRRVFKPRNGCIFLDADYSQIELRILAHMSKDEDLIAAYMHNQDIHRSTAAKVFHTSYEEVTDLQRRNAKAVNFGIVYGISAFGLSQDLDISRKEAQEYIDQYFAMYPSVKSFIDELVQKAKECGFAQTLSGRKRPVPELKSSNFMQRSFGERVAMNSPIQGTAADIIKLAMVRVFGRLKKEGLRAKVVLQVHDELLVETPIEEKEAVAKILKEEMEQVMKLSVPLEAEVLEGNDWKEAH